MDLPPTGRTRRFGTAPRILLLALLPIGDSLFATPTILALRRRYPHARITALVRQNTAPLMASVPALDDVAVLPLGPDWAGPGALWRTLRHLRARRYDVAIDFTSPAYKWISAACGIPIRTYMKFDPLWWLIPGNHDRWRATHATRHYYDCARELDLPPWDEVNHVPELHLPPAACDNARTFLRDHGAGVDARPLIGLHAGGAGLGGLKRWPSERFALLADRLHAAWGARIVLLGGPQDEHLAADIAAAMGTSPISAAGAVPLLTSLALIESCDLFIGNDSGPLHAAATLGTSYVGIFGPTAPANFHPMATRPGQGLLVLPPRPCGCTAYFVGGDTMWHRRCCREHCHAMAAITVDTVYAPADALLRRRFMPAVATDGAPGADAGERGAVGVGVAR